MSTQESKLIIVGIDGSQTALLAAQFAAEICEKVHGDIELVFVRKPRAGTQTWGAVHAPADTERADQQFAEACLKKASGELPPLKHEPVLTVLIGATAEELLTHAESRAAMMVVVGHRGIGASTRVPLGHSADTVVHTSTVPVLVFRPRSSP